MRPTVLAAALAVYFGLGCAQLMPDRAFFLPDKPKSLDELVRTIDDGPDFCHNDYTLSVNQLIKIGEPAIPRMLDLMLLDGETTRFTRLHAHTVLWIIFHNKFEAKWGPWERGEPNECRDKENAIWASLGSLSPGNPNESDSVSAEHRQRAVQLWREWYAKGCPLPDN